MFIELLESRIAPASLIFSANQKSVTWTDSDGDSVKLKVTSGTLEEANFVHEDAGVGLVVNSLDLTDPEFAGTSLTIIAKRVASPNSVVGNSFVDLGYINAAGNSLATVRIDGDLGRIDAGLAVLTPQTATAIKSLSAVSIGTRPDLLDGVLAESEINGKVGSINITGGLHGAIHVTGDALGSINKLTVGSIVGGDLADSGRVDVSGKINVLQVLGSVQGGQGQHSGSVEASGSIGSVTIGGSLAGGRGADSSSDGTGVIRAGTTIGSVAIRGSIYGGTQQESGLVDAGGAIARISVGGDIQGGSAGQDNGGIQAAFVGVLKVKGDVHGGIAQHSGFIDAVSGGAFKIGGLIGGDASDSGILTVGAVTSIKVTGDIVGGDLADTASNDIENSGTITARRIGKLIVEGSIRAGADYNSSFDLVSTAAVRVTDKLSSIVVEGALLGTQETRVLVTARGRSVPEINSGSDVAIGKASFGSVAYADILAGYSDNPDLASAALNPNAQISSVTVKGSWTASNLVAGAAYRTAFGDGGDVKSAGVDNPSITSRIGKVVIMGAVQGTSDAGDFYGIVAQSIGSVKFGAAAESKVLLNAGASNDNDTASLRYSLANTGDVRIFEVPS